MPYNSNGVHTLDPGYKAITGQDIVPSQHNPPFEDCSSSLSMAYVKDGRAPLTGDMNAGGNKLTNLANGVAPQDAATVGQAASAIGDFKDSVRELDESWLRRDGSIYPIADYPDLAALLPALSDGVDWSNLTSGTTSAIKAMAYGDGKYVFVGDGGLILVTTDLVNFSIKTSGTASAITGIAYGNGIWVAITQNSVLVSSDAETWSSGSTGVPANLSICFGGGKFVVGGATGSNYSDLRYSTNGTSWSANVAPASSGGGVYSLAYNGTFYLGGTQGSGAFNVAYKSTDGITWTTAVTGATVLFRSIATDGTTFVMVGDNGTILSTTNGTSFTARVSGTTTALNGIAYASPVGWMVVGNTGLALISANLSSWVAGGAPGTTANLNAIMADPDTSGLYLVGGAGGLLKKAQRTLPSQFRVPNDKPDYGWIKALAA